MNFRTVMLAVASIGVVNPGAAGNDAVLDAICEPASALFSKVDAVLSTKVVAIDRSMLLSRDPNGKLITSDVAEYIMYSATYEITRVYSPPTVSGERNVTVLEYSACAGCNLDDLKKLLPVAGSRQLLLLNRVDRILQSAESSGALSEMLSFAPDTDYVAAGACGRLLVDADGTNSEAEAYFQRKH